MSIEKHPSHSGVQLGIEHQVLCSFSEDKEFIKMLDSDQVFEDIKNLKIQPDGILKTKNGEYYVVEIFAHIGNLKAGQKKKIAADVLKLAYVKSKHSKYRVQILFVDKTCLESAQSAWVYEASKHFGIEMLFVALPPELKKKLKDTQNKQSDAQAVSSKAAQA